MVRFVLRTGIVSERSQAEAILFIFFIACVLITLWATLRDTRPEFRPEDDPNYEPAIVR